MEPSLGCGSKPTTQWSWPEPPARPELELELDELDDEEEEELDDDDELDELEDELEDELDELEVEPPLPVPPQAAKAALSSTTPVSCKEPPGHLRKILFIETVPCLSWKGLEPHCYRMRVRTVSAFAADDGRDTGVGCR